MAIALVALSGVDADRRRTGGNVCVCAIFGEVLGGVIAEELAHELGVGASQLFRLKPPANMAEDTRHGALGALASGVLATIERVAERDLNSAGDQVAILVQDLPFLGQLPHPR